MPALKLLRIALLLVAATAQSVLAQPAPLAETRPFVVNGQPTCTPASEETLRNDGSYPSGHTAIGWAWALILTELAPDRSTEILKRGQVFGESRMVCNVHWAQDVRQGMHMGAATVALLQANPQFRADMDQARAEVAAIRASGRPAVRDCEAEAAVMVQGSGAAPVY